MAAETIISVLANIPWGQVMENAPKVADGAAKLWNVVTRKKPDQSLGESAKAVRDATEADTEIWKRRLVAMEENIQHLEEQLGSSAELIKALAEQNTQLVNRIELNNVRLIQLTKATVAIAVVLVGVTLFLILRP